MSSLASYSKIAEEMDTLDAMAAGDICAGCHGDDVAAEFREKWSAWLCDSCHEEAGQ